MSNEGPGAWGKGIAGMLRTEIAGVRKFHPEIEPSIRQKLPQVGEELKLEKTALTSGSNSVIPAGGELIGKLQAEIVIGSGVLLDTGKTSPVTRIFVENGSLSIQTQSSIYKLWRKAEAIAQPIQKNENLASEAPKKGDKVTVRKILLGEGQSSQIQVGEALEGTLIKDVVLGEQVLFGSGNTSPVKSMRHEGNRLIVETQTSVYEITKG